MKRKTSIIISITGITIIALTLLGLTFGYYYTRITGNTNSKSISITIGDTSVVYTDLSPSAYSVIIEPGYETAKLFTVQNTGNTRATYSIYLDEVTNNFVRYDDITYVLYRIENTEIDLEDLTAAEVVAKGVFPKTDSFIKTDEIIETPNSYYTYALIITYINSNENQDIDQGHTFGATVQIMSSYENPFVNGTLASAIFDNSINISNEEKLRSYAEFTAPPISTPAQTISNNDESILTTINEDEGLSYYYRGRVNNNYVNFNNMCWRIVRIESDGTVKLILADAEETCNINTPTKLESASIGNGVYGIGTYEESSIKTNMETWFTNNITASNIAKIKTSKKCIGDTSKSYNGVGTLLTEIPTNENTYYETGKRLYGIGDDKAASLICYSGKSTVDLQVVPITAEEVALSGASINTPNETYYLNENASNIDWWTISNKGISCEDSICNSTALIVKNNGALEEATKETGVAHYRPTISLISTTKIDGGIGSLENPYNIK